MAGTLTTQRPRRLAPWLRRSPLLALSNMEDLMERFWEDEDGGAFSGMLAPPVDLKETGKDISVRVDLPGIDPKEIDIQVSDNQLMISGERREEKEEKGETFHRIERRSGRFSRSIALPCAIDEAKVEASYKDGVLTVSMPKTAESKGRRIEVKS